MNFIVITDLVKMDLPHICIAGYLQENMTCMRLLLRNKDTDLDWISADNGIIKPFTKIIVEVMRNKGNPRPHDEDTYIYQAYKIIEEEIPDSEKIELLTATCFASIEDIFETEILGHTYLLEGTGKRSLGTIEAVSAEFHTYVESSEHGRPEIRGQLIITDKTNTIYTLPITDLHYWAYIQHKFPDPGTVDRDELRHFNTTLSASISEADTIYLRIGLGRPVAKQQNSMYLQVTGIYSFPDYLNHGDYYSSLF